MMDVGTLAGTYRVGLPPRPLRGAAWIFIGAAIVALLLGDVLVNHRWPILLGIYLMIYAVPWWVRRTRPPMTVIANDALRVRPRVGARPWELAWEDVLIVHPPTRWQEHARAVTRRNGEVPLPGLSAPDAAALAALVAAEHPGLPRSATHAAPPTSTHDHRPMASPGGTDWDGPFTPTRFR